MKILNASIKNFGSYKDLMFDFENKGLVLLYGPTGSGKSTIQDIIPWILFGKTSKNGAVSDVRNWDSKDCPTVGLLNIQLKVGQLSITRIRGTSQQNDLFYKINGSSELYRGKDVLDTQKNIVSLLGVSYDEFCVATCYNEFSETKMFFSNKPKNQRDLFESITKIDFFESLLAGILLEKKLIIKQAEDLNTQKNKLSSEITQFNTALINIEEKVAAWEHAHKKDLSLLKAKEKAFKKDKKNKIEIAKSKSYVFEEEKAKKIADLIDQLDFLDQKIVSDDTLNSELEKLNTELEMCEECGQQIVNYDDIKFVEEKIRSNRVYKEKFTQCGVHLRCLQSSKNPYEDQVYTAENEKNYYSEQIESRTKQKNPLLDLKSQTTSFLLEKEDLLEKVLSNYKYKEYKLSCLTQLNDLAYELRGLLLKNVVQKIETNTNFLLKDHFDSDFNVTFSIGNWDEIETIITKNSYSCNYAQLSKGQRSLLNLCVSISIMKEVRNKTGVYFNVLNFDEALDGMDTDLKISAFSLFQALAKEHSTVLLVEHDPQFQGLFDKKIKVQINSDESEISYE